MCCLLLHITAFYNHFLFVNSPPILFYRFLPSQQINMFTHILFKLCLLVTKQSTAWHVVISTNCAFQLPLFPTFLLSVPLLVVIWSYPEQGYNSATGYFVWLVHSPGTVYHWTFVRQLHYQRSKTCSRHIFSHVLTSLTNCFPEYEQWTLYSTLVVTLLCHVTAPYKLSFYYYYYYYYYY